MHYIGIDPSLTGTGLADYDSETKTFRTAVVKSNPAAGIAERVWRYDGLLKDVKDFLAVGWIRGTGIDGIALEGYSFGSKGCAILNLAEWGGILRHYLVLKEEYFVVEVPPACLKLFVCGKGGGSGTDKAGVRMGTYKRWGIDLQEPNQCDAYVLARMAACHWGGEKAENAAQRRALEKLK